ncbi:MAG: alpha/beta hydrolase [Planctomycetes bacterium]|nr:alpha/beta hydrolase [Planctomycetota bacterium]
MIRTQYSRRFSHLVLLSFVSLFLVGPFPHARLLRAQGGGVRAPDGIAYHPNIECGKGGEQVLQLDLASPEELARPAPCVVLIHGGAWRGGKKDDALMTSLLFEFSKAGYVTASIQYRLCPKHQFPAQIEDVKCAIRFLRAHADKYHINAAKIGAVGFSAGGHLAMMLGVTGPKDDLEGNGGWADQNSQVQVAVSFFGPTDLAADDLPDPSKLLVKDFLGGTKEEKSESYRRASPINFLDDNDAPILMLQGTRDRLVPHTQVYRMLDAMTSARVKGRAEILAGADHGWLGPDLDESKRQTFEFLARHLTR